MAGALDRRGHLPGENDDPRPPFYALCMYPYPSGPAHQGHVRNYTFGDLVVRYQTMQGHAVLSPLGFDSFGLPAENAAIRTGTHPRIFTDARIAELKESLTRLGAVYDWRREVRSHDPSYIRWNQVIFLRLLQAGLAYRATAPVNWCPGCQTVLANEQVLADGRCERSGDLVIKRDLEQWFFRITAYADELLDALDDLDWPERVKAMQRNWIGRSEGAEFDLPVVGRDGTDGRPALALRVFTTRPDTSFGMTYAVVAPEHPLVDELTTSEHRGEVDALRRRAADETEIERSASAGRRHRARDAGGLHRQLRASTPSTASRFPVYVADYVLMAYGTGAIMAVPAEDDRDWAFARTYGLADRPDRQAPGRLRGGGGAYSGEGEKINSGFLDGLDVVDRQGPRHRMVGGGGHRHAEGQLPAPGLAGVAPAVLGLPDPGRLLPGPRHRRGPARPAPGARPRRRGVPADRPVAVGHERGVPQTTCPNCGGPASRETDTMDTFVDSSWYFLRFCDPFDARAPFDGEAAQHWMPVDEYIGGVEHAILHLLYARFYSGP